MMIHKIWFEENNEGVQTDIEFWCPEIPKEIEDFNRAIETLERN